MNLAAHGQNPAFGKLVTTTGLGRVFDSFILLSNSGVATKRQVWVLIYYYYLILVQCYWIYFAEKERVSPKMVTRVCCTILS